MHFTPEHEALRRTVETFVEREINPHADAWEEAGASFGSTRYLTPWLPLRIDFIYALAGAFELRSVVVPRVSCSDHMPVRLRARLLTPLTPLSARARAAAC